MKVLVEIDDAVMAKVMDITASKTEEEAIRLSVDRMSTKDWMKDYYLLHPRLTSEELKDMIDPDYDLQAIRDATIWPRPNTPDYETAALSG